jgi:hypothetical protein
MKDLNEYIYITTIDLQDEGWENVLICLYSTIILGLTF